MIRYVFKDEPLIFKNAAIADPKVIGTSLAKIAKDNGGRLRPRQVVEVAKNPSHALHKHFEWDDAVAANAYRVNEARVLIRSIHVVENDSSPPAFYTVHAEDTSYRTLKDVRSNVDLQDAILRAAERELEAFEHRFHELADVCSLVKQAREAVTRRRNESRPEARP